MKLLNQSLTWISLSILVIISIWSVIFYYNMLDEIHDSIDDGLENTKLLIIRKYEVDTTIFNKEGFDESNYSIKKINQEEAFQQKDLYKDTLLYMQNEKDLEPVRMLTTAFENQGHFYRLKVITSMVEEDDLIEDLVWSIFWLYLILLVSIILTNNLVLRKIWNPFYTLLEQLKNFRIDRNEEPPNIETNTKEFIELKRAIQELVKHTMEAYANQKNFTENAAHELQTPLASAKSQLELLIEEGGVKGSNVKTVGHVLETIERLRLLNKSMLLLSKIENRQFFKNQPISLDVVVRKCLEDLNDFIQFKNINLSLAESNSPEIEMDSTLAHILISNLLKNAIFHNVHDGVVSIVIDKRNLEIRNSSTKTSLDKQKIFDRFYKSNDDEKNTGLGLAIVKAICNLYGFTIVYHFDGQHSFKIIFKK